MRILLAEDEPVFRDLLQKMLAGWGYQVEVARDGAEACQMLLAEHAPRLAILDWKMPGMEGVEVCRKLREEQPEIYTYVILLTSQQREEDLIAGMDAGADDYIVKPFKHNELRVRLRAGRRVIELHEELSAAREILQEKASHDSLTGLSNREEILGVLDRELARFERDGVSFSIIMADIDHFKTINDRYGHLTGDAVLRLSAQKMHSLMRSYDAIGRYGGEEFLIVLPECCGECALVFAERLRICVCSDPMDTPEGMIPVTVSLGVASSGIIKKTEGKCLVKAADAAHCQAKHHPPVSGLHLGHLLVKAADAALYQAKNNGRNRVEVASEDRPLEATAARLRESAAGASVEAGAARQLEEQSAHYIEEIAQLRRQVAASQMAALESAHCAAQINDAREFASNILEVVGEPFVVLNSELKVVTANRRFYDAFRLNPGETVGTHLYQVGAPWDSPKLRLLLEQVLPGDSVCDGYPLELELPDTGRTTLFVNARMVFQESSSSNIILLALAAPIK